MTDDANQTVLPSGAKIVNVSKSQARVAARDLERYGMTPVPFRGGGPGRLRGEQVGTTPDGHAIVDTGGPFLYVVVAGKGGGFFPFQTAAHADVRALLMKQDAERRQQR